MKEFVSWRMIDTILPSKEEFIRAISGRRRLRFYFGIDPTGPDLHLGHSVALWFLRDMQRLGHEVIVLLGDFTARIGDPSGKDASRRQLSEEEVRKNMRTYRKQLGTLLSFGKGKNPAKLMRNSRWLRRLRLSEFIRIASHVTLQQLLERDMFRRRVQEKKPIVLNEFLYPLLQGYDSVALDADAEVGGVDQLFNMMVGKKLREIERGKSKFVIAMRLLEDPETGKKMSKSEGVYVPLSATPEDLYGKVMALPDGMVWICFELATDLRTEEIHALRRRVRTGKDMREAKTILAERIVSWVHSKSAARQSRKAFERTFVAKLPPRKAPTVMLSKGTRLFLPKFLSAYHLVRSRSEAMRILEARGVFVDEVLIEDWKTPIVIERDLLIRVGKKKFLRIVAK